MFCFWLRGAANLCVCVFKRQCDTCLVGPGMFLVVSRNRVLIGDLSLGSSDFVHFWS